MPIKECCKSCGKDVVKVIEKDLSENNNVHSINKCKVKLVDSTREKCAFYKWAGKHNHEFKKLIFSAQKKDTELSSKNLAHLNPWVESGGCCHLNNPSGKERTKCCMLKQESQLSNPKNGEIKHNCGKNTDRMFNDVVPEASVKLYSTLKSRVPVKKNRPEPHFTYYSIPFSELIRKRQVINVKRTTPLKPVPNLTLENANSMADYKKFCDRLTDKNIQDSKNSLQKLIWKSTDLFHSSFCGPQGDGQLSEAIEGMHIEPVAQCDADEFKALVKPVDIQQDLEGENDLGSLTSLTSTKLKNTTSHPIEDLKKEMESASGRQVESAAQPEDIRETTVGEAVDLESLAQPVSDKLKSLVAAVKLQDAQANPKLISMDVNIEKSLPKDIAEDIVDNKMMSDIVKSITVNSKTTVAEKVQESHEI